MIRNIVISIVIISIAALTTFNHWNASGITTDAYLPFINSGIGLLAVLFLLSRSGVGNFFYLIWVLLQLAVVELTTEVNIDLENLTLGTMSLSELNFTQYFFYELQGTSFNIDGYVIHLNLIPFAYFLLFLIPNTSVSGTNGMPPQAKTVKGGGLFELRLYRLNSYMERIVPQQVKVLKKVDFKDNENWFLVRLSKPVKVKGGRVIKNALIKPKDGYQFFKNQSGQLGYFRLLMSETLDLRKSRFIDWVLVR